MNEKDLLVFTDSVAKFIEDSWDNFLKIKDSNEDERPGAIQFKYFLIAQLKEAKKMIKEKNV